MGGNGQAFVYAAGEMQELGRWVVEPGVQRTTSPAVAVGSGMTANGSSRGFIWKPGDGTAAVVTFGRGEQLRDGCRR